MSYRRHELTGVADGLRDATGEFRLDPGQRYGAAGGRCIIDMQIHDFSHVRIYPKDGIRVVHVCNMTSSITSSLIQYCTAADIIVARDALNFKDGSEGWFGISFPEDAAYCYVSSSNGTMKIMK